MKVRTLHFEYTNGCNSRCVMCDYWQNPLPVVLQNETVLSAVSSLVSSGLKKVYFTGGECLLFASNLFEVCTKLKETYPWLELGLVTNGILIEKYYQTIGALFSKVILSLDTVDPEKYIKIRGVNALSSIERGVHLLRENFPGVRINLRMLVLNDTVDNIIPIIDYAIAERLHHVSFLPEDSSNSVAFGRNASSKISSHRNTDCLVKLQDVIATIADSYSQYFGNLLPRGCEDLEYIYSSYSGANKCGRKCTKAVSSCVISANGTVNPCFFILGNQTLENGTQLAALLDSDVYRMTVSAIVNYQYSACTHCACPKELS